MRPLSHSEPSRGCAGGRVSRSRPPLPLQPCLLSSAATCILLMVFNLTRSGPTPGPLHWLCLLPRTLFPRCLNGPCPHFLLVFSKRDLFFKKKKNFKKFHLLIIFGFPRSQLQPKRSLLRHAGFFLRCMSSLVVTRRLRFSMACGILDPPPGTGPPSPTLPGAGLTTGPPRKSLREAFSVSYI